MMIENVKELITSDPPLVNDLVADEKARNFLADSPELHARLCINNFVLCWAIVRPDVTSNGLMLPVALTPKLNARFKALPESKAVLASLAAEFILDLFTVAKELATDFESLRDTPT